MEPLCCDEVKINVPPRCILKVMGPLYAFFSYGSDICCVWLSLVTKNMKSQWQIPSKNGKEALAYMKSNGVIYQFCLDSVLLLLAIAFHTTNCCWTPVMDPGPLLRV